MLLREKARIVQCNFAARQELILHYSDMVKRYAKKYETENVSYDDLVSIGMIELIDTIDGYGLQETNIGTIVANAIRKRMERYVITETKRIQSLCELKNCTCEESYEIDDVVATHMLTNDLICALRTLTERDRMVITLRFYYGLTLEDVGKILGCTSQYVRYMEAKALRKLRHPFRSRKLKDYLY